jgi:hypothetical protein
MSDGNTSAVKQGINIRTMEDAEEMSVCVELQQRIWGYAPIDTVPDQVFKFLGRSIDRRRAQARSATHSRDFRTGSLGSLSTARCANPWIRPGARKSPTATGQPCEVSDVGRTNALYRLFRLAGVGGCNVLRAQALFKYLSFRSPPPLP